MEVKLFSDKYAVHKLTNGNIDEIYELLSKNALYYEYCPPLVTRQSIKDDMNALPPEKTMEDKYYLGFYQQDKLIAVMDLIDGYSKKGLHILDFL